MPGTENTQPLTLHSGSACSLVADTNTNQAHKFITTTVKSYNKKGGAPEEILRYITGQVYTRTGTE